MVFVYFFILRRKFKTIWTPYLKLDLNVKNIDVFCEEGVYNVDQSRRMLAAGHEQGNVVA